MRRIYLRAQPEQEWYNIGHRTLECTKRMMSLKLYAALRICGTRCFADYVTAAFDLGQRFGEMIAEEKEFELPVKPECNIVCFRHIPAGWTGAATALDALQAKVRKKLIEAGAFYLVQTQLRGRVYLRVTLINPLTTEQDLYALLGAVRVAARELS